MSATLIAIGAGAALGLASIPHCIGMCGPIAGACSGSVRSGVGYQLARIAAYSSLGALAAFALLPVREALSGGATAWIFALITAFALLLSAYRIGRLGRQNGENTTQSSELIPAASLKRPKGQTQNRPGLALPVGLGLITGLLPCGAFMAPSLWLRRRAIRWLARSGWRALPWLLRPVSSSRRESSAFSHIAARPSAAPSLSARSCSAPSSSSFARSERDMAQDMMRQIATPKCRRGKRSC